MYLRRRRPVVHCIGASSLRPRPGPTPTRVGGCTRDTWQTGAPETRPTRTAHRSCRPFLLVRCRRRRLRRRLFGRARTAHSLRSFFSPRSIGHEMNDDWQVARRAAVAHGGLCGHVLARHNAGDRRPPRWSEYVSARFSAAVRARRPPPPQSVAHHGPAVCRSRRRRRCHRPPTPIGKSTCIRCASLHSASFSDVHTIAGV